MRSGASCTTWAARPTRTTRGPEMSSPASRPSSSPIDLGELTVGGRPRRFALSLPRTRSGGGIPLVIVLHGNHPEATGQMMRDWTTFDEQAGAFGFAVAYPDGIGGCWADGRGVTTS